MGDYPDIFCREEEKKTGKNPFRRNLTNMQKAGY